MKTIATTVISLTIGFLGGYFFALDVGDEVSISAKNKVNTADRVVSKPVETSQKNNQGKKVLEGELLAANHKITDLTELNQALSNQIEQMDIPVPASTTYLELMERIDKLPATFINQQLSYLFDEDYISSIEDPHEFSKELIEVALSDEKDENALGTANIAFSYSPIVGLRYLGGILEIDQYDTVYAHISPTHDIPNSIVRWQHTTTGEILLFKQLSLSTNVQSQYVVIRPSNGWYSGHYQVTIQDMNNKQLVGANSFYVTKVRINEEINNANGPDYDIIQDLILTGQAFPK